jgi:integrase
MAQTIGRLSAIKVAKIKGPPGYFADGANLYLRVAPGGSRGWIFRFTIGGRTRDMGLGSYPEISLASARALADNFRKHVKAGIDPIEHRRAERAAQRVAAAKNLSFDECARDYIKEYESSWRNTKHRAQWASTLKRYTSPVFGKLPASSVDVALVLKALKPIWNSKPETASRVRGRIEAVLDWARVHGYRVGENPARWKGNLKGALPNHANKRNVEHYAALPFSEIGSFMATLRERSDVGASALEFTILTAARSSETLGATWGEFDFQNKVWTVPAARMKASREHRVPLSPPALALLDRMRNIRDREFLFPGSRAGQPLSAKAMLMTLRRMGRVNLTVHGFRSTFRDWAAERTNFPREVVEMALAHRIGDQTEAAYWRGDLFDKRRRLMTLWAEYCTTSRGGEVVPLRHRTPKREPSPG